MSLVESLCLLLISAHLLGLLAARLGQPELLGHMAAGILLGPAGLRWVGASEALNTAADMAVLFVVIASGLELRLATFVTVYRGSGLVRLLPGFLLPVLAGLALARGFAYDWTAAAVIALCVAVTALPVALRILSSFGLLGTRMAEIAIAGALLADVLVLLVLGLLPTDTAAGQATFHSQLAQGVLKLIALLAMVWLASWALRRLGFRGAQPAPALSLTRPVPALLLILALAAGCDWVGLHFAVGAFLGALIVSDCGAPSHEFHALHTPLEGMNGLIFAPLFLAAQGTHFATGSLVRADFIAALIVAAVASKLAGGYWSARCHGLSRHASRGVAIVMNARGLMEMVVASIAFRAGLTDAGLYSALLTVGVVTTFCTPLLLRRWQVSTGRH